MRGTPLLEGLLFLILWLLLLVPVVLVTGGSPWAFSSTTSVERNDTGVSATSESIDTWVTVRFSHPPVWFSLRSNGQTLWEDASPSIEMDRLLSLPSGSTLKVEAHWQEPARRAFEVLFEPVVGQRWRHFQWVSSAVFRESIRNE